MFQNKRAIDRAEPYRIKAIEFMTKTTREYREKKIEEVGYNVFYLRADDVFIDLLTDSGVGAMSNHQWAGIMMGDESYAGGKNFWNLKDSVKDVLGFPYVVPTHQGRGAENILNRVIFEEGAVVPGNKHFDTTKAHIEDKNGIAVDCTIDEAEDPENLLPFKGNLDLKKLGDAISRYGADNIPYILITVTCNSGGGQPVSMENIRAVHAMAKEQDILVFFDIARYAENAYFIQQREKEYQDTPVKDIVLEMMSYADGALMSAKKDAIVNIGGFIVLRDKELDQKCAAMGVLYEGFPTYGGLAGRDIEAMARGLREGIREDYLESRIRQVHYLGDRLKDADIPIINPVGGHAVYVDGKGFLPHIPQDQFPSQTLVGELFLEAGVRAVEIGTVLDGRDPQSGKNRMPKLDMMRLTIPRRVYTYNHMDVVVEAMEAIRDRKDDIVGLEFKEEPEVLRHFLATYRRVR